MLNKIFAAKTLKYLRNFIFFASPQVTYPYRSDFCKKPALEYLMLGPLQVDRTMLLYKLLHAIHKFDTLRMCNASTYKEETPQAKLSLKKKSTKLALVCYMCVFISMQLLTGAE
jgi:hypothetical protein